MNTLTGQCLHFTALSLDRANAQTGIGGSVVSSQEGRHLVSEVNR